MFMLWSTVELPHDASGDAIGACASLRMEYITTKISPPRLQASQLASLARAPTAAVLSLLSLVYQRHNNSVIDHS